MDTIKIADENNQDRLRFFRTAAMAVAATRLGMISPAAAQRVEAQLPAAPPPSRTLVQGPQPQKRICHEPDRKSRVHGQTDTTGGRENGASRIRLSETDSGEIARQLETLGL